MLSGNVMGVLSSMGSQHKQEWDECCRRVPREMPQCRHCRNGGCMDQDDGQGNEAEQVWPGHRP
jgi:hypothetical protein